MHINRSRLKQHFEAMSLIGKIGETGTNRPAHSPTEKEAFKIARSALINSSENLTVGL